MEELQNWFKDKRSVLIAYSGGVDSSLLIKVAHAVLGRKAVAVTSDSQSMARNELSDAKRLADIIGIEHVIVHTEELSNPNYLSNPKNRCYYCKKELFMKLKPLAEERGIDVIVDGTNADDLLGHRPGSLAEEEEGIRRPFVELGITKHDIRGMSRQLGLQTAEKPSMPCLSSRFAYGEPITLKGLSQIERAESIIKDITGIKVVRVRNHGEIARIEVGREERKVLFNEELLDKVHCELKRIGFKHVSMELSGYSSGSLN